MEGGTPPAEFAMYLNYPCELSSQEALMTFKWGSYSTLIYGPSATNTNSAFDWMIFKHTASSSAQSQQPKLSQVSTRKEGQNKQAR